MTSISKGILFTFLLLIAGCNSNDLALSEISDTLPVILLETENESPILSKENYIRGTVEILSENNNEHLLSRLSMKGRGNSTWDFPKKPYQIKFDTKESLLGMPEDRKWILLANYSDKSLLRNEVAFDMSRMSNLDWTPESRFVQLVVNNEYLGVYQITQKVEESLNRVNIGNEGYLLEVDRISRLDSDDVYFETSNYLFNIKEPKVDFDDNQYNIIKNFISLTESTLLGNNFSDPIEGYAKYIDVNSFVDWYLINEITKNTDAKFHTSVYMHYTPGGKLKMGPVWDFDISLGNINYNNCETIDGFWIKDATWYSRLFQDPNFVLIVKERFNYFYESRNLFQEQILTNSFHLSEAQKNNFEKWPILGVYVWPNNVVHDTYDEELSYLSNWLDQRLEWLKISLNEL